MTITASGPDGTTFSFPDGTSPDVISGAVRKHYGGDQAPAEQPAAAAPPTTAGMIGTEALRGVPIVGPAITNRYGSAGREEWEKAHPWLSTGLQMAGGGAALALAPEVEGAALGTSMIPRALGMVGKARTAVPLAAATGAGLNAADALARGEDPKTAAIGGALTGAGGVLGGKAVGALYDAATRTFRPQAPVQRFLPNRVAGVDVPVSEAQLATAQGTPDVNATRAEQRMYNMGVPTAREATEATNTAMNQAHTNFSDMLNPNAQPGVSVHPLDAGEAAAGDLVQQEQQRAAAEVARMTGARADTAQMRQTLGGGAQPAASVSDVGDLVSQGINNRFQQARQGVNANYQTLRSVPGEFNPRYLLNMGENVIRPNLDNPTRVGLPRSERVYVKPDLMPNTSAALQDIDHEMGQLALTNEVARGNRPITADDIEEVRKLLVQRMQAANSAARANVPNAWQDVRGMQRLMQEFDRHMMDVITAPRGFSGDAQAYFDAIQNARSSHADMRRLFSRSGSGDKVGQFMENVIGKFPGQELSPDGIMKQLLGSPDQIGTGESAVPILRHLRDNVFGANSQEWGQIKQAVLDHMTATPPGGEPIPFAKQASRVERMLGNNRFANAVFSPTEQADLAAHAANLRGAVDVAPQPNTVEAKIAALSGRGGTQAAGGQQIMDTLFRSGGEQVAAALRQQLPTDIWNDLRVGAFKRVAEAPEGMTPFGHQRSAQQIAKFLNTPLARELFNGNELAVLKGIGDAHRALIPTPGGTNPSGTAYMGEHMLKGMKRQFLKMIFAGFGHLPGYAAGEALGRAADKFDAAREASEAVRRFIGPRPVGPAATAPQRIGALAGRVIQPPQLTDQSAGQ